MHVIQGVFDITTQNVVPVGASLSNVTGNAWEFVAIRWNTMFAGVLIWRVYDVGLLLLVVSHGFNGLRQVVNDYAHSVIVNRGLNIAVLTTAVGLMIVGALAILNSVPADTLKLIQQAAQAAH
jgi:succinate dehydrogenase hydrophobic anchor subunit